MTARVVNVFRYVVVHRSHFNLAYNAISSFQTDLLLDFSLYIGSPVLPGSWAVLMELNIEQVGT